MMCVVIIVLLVIVSCLVLYWVISPLLGTKKARDSSRPSRSAADEGERERLAGLWRDGERAAQLRKDTLAGKLHECPKCHKVSVFWNALGKNGEGCFECLSCGKVYVTEYDLFVAECNARNEEKFRDSQRFND